MKTQTRSLFIDNLRGLGMILVLIHHCGYLKIYILAFHMPLFFIISGMLNAFNKKHTNRSLSNYVKDKFFRLYIPYFIFSFGCLALATLVKLIFKFLDIEDVFVIKFPAALRDIFFVQSSLDYQGITSRFWYLPCAFFTSIFVFAIHKLIHRVNENIQNCIIIGLIFFCWLMSYIENSVFPDVMVFGLDIVLMSVAFTLFGEILYLLVVRFWNANIIKQIPVYLILALCYVISVNLNSEPFLMFINSYGNYFYAILGAVSGSMMFILLAHIVVNDKKIKVLDFFGRNTIAIYPLHLIIIAGVSKAFSYFEPLSTAGILRSALLLMFTTILLYPCIKFINKYLPILNGNYRAQPTPKFVRMKLF